MTENIPVYIKGTHKVLQADPALGNPVIQGDQEAAAPLKALPKGDAKVTLVLDPLSVTRVYSEGKKQTKLTVTVGPMKCEAMINSKSYRKTLASLDKLGADNCNIILQASMTHPGTLEAAGLAVMPKATKPVAEQEAQS
jgi:hypothetical protein